MKNQKMKNIVIYKRFTGDFMTDEEYQQQLEWEMKQPEWKEYVKSMKNLAKMD